MGRCYPFLRLCLVLASVLVVGSNANLQFTNPSLELLTAGAPFNVTWSGAIGTTTLTLQNGTSSTGMVTVNTVAFGLKNQFVLWSPYATTPTGTYVLRLVDTSGQTAYSADFVMLPSGTKTTATTGLQFTNSGFEGITAGKAFNVTWAGASGSTTLTLQKGAGNAIADINVIASGITTSFISWSPYASIPAAQYVLKLVDSAGAIAYSNLFNMLASGSSSSSSSSISSTSTSSASVSSTATNTATQTQTSATTTPSPTSSSIPASPALSTGAKAGIGIGATVGGLAVISTLILLYLRHYKISVSKKPSSSGSNSITTFGMPVNSSGYEKPLLGGVTSHEIATNGDYESVPPAPPAELGADGENKPPVEMLADKGAHEIGGHQWDGRGARRI